MTRRVLIAGVGNVFFRDDGFGVEVAQRLRSEPLPDGVVAADYGIRGVHLAYELLDPPELLLVVDLAPRGSRPGTLHVLEPDLQGLDLAPRSMGHGMNLSAVFASVLSMGGRLPRLRIVGCEPADVTEGMGLTDPVRRAVEPATALVLRLIAMDGPSTVREEERTWRS